MTFLRESFCLARDLLDPGLFCQAIYGPEHRLGAQVSRAPAREEPLLTGLQDLLMACKVPWPLKAANRGHTDIKLRERGTKKVHVFTGERVQVDKPKGAPAWMPDKIWKPMVKKVGVETLEEL